MSLALSAMARKLFSLWRKAPSMATRELMSWMTAAIWPACGL